MTDSKGEINFDKVSRLRHIMTSLGINDDKEFAKRIDLSKSYISEIFSYNKNVPRTMKGRLKEFLNISEDWFEKGEGEMIMEANDSILNHSGIGVPMYNVPGSAGGVEIYNDLSSYNTIGHLNFPGATKDSFALPVYGSSMFPTLEDGSWAVLRPIMNKFSIIWGEVYYIEWGDYRVYKRLLAGDEDDDVILWSDNQDEKINGKPIYTQIKIKKAEIQRICLVTDKYKKANN